MNKSELIEELTAKTGYNPKLTDKMVRIFFDRIKAALSAGDKVEINQPKHKGEIYEIVRVKRTNCIIQSKDNVMETYNCPISMLIA